MQELLDKLPIEISDPRCFFLEPVIDPDQALTEAGDYKGRVFGFDVRRFLPGQKEKSRIEAHLRQRRLVPFWYISCLAHFDYNVSHEYEIVAKNADAIMITLQGSEGKTLNYRVDRTGRSEGRVAISGTERCVTDPRYAAFIDSYVKQVDSTPVEIQAEQHRFEKYSRERQRLVGDLQEFGLQLSVDNSQLFTDNLETIIVPPLETADTVVKRAFKQVTIRVEPPGPNEWYLKIRNVDLYFRPLYVFEFEKFGPDNKRQDRRSAELDALDRTRWTTLATSEYQIPTVPWGKILRLSSDIALALLRDVPVLGQSLEISKLLIEQSPSIIDDLRGGS